MTRNDLTTQFFVVSFFHAISMALWPNSYRVNHLKICQCDERTHFKKYQAVKIFSLKDLAYVNRVCC